MGLSDPVQAEFLLLGSCVPVLEFGVSFESSLPCSGPSLPVAPLEIFAVVAIPREGFASAIPSIPLVRLGLCGAALSEGVPSACSPAPSGRAVIMGVDVVVDFLPRDFACNELLS